MEIQKLSKEELQRREIVFEQAYGDRAIDTYRDLREELFFVCGGLKSIAAWGHDYLATTNKEAQLEMFLTDYFPHLETLEFPRFRTPAQQDALHNFQMAAIRNETIFGQPGPNQCARPRQKLR